MDKAVAYVLLLSIIIGMILILRKKKPGSTSIIDKNYLWQQYHGISNDPNLIKVKAAGLAELICATHLKQVNGILSDLNLEPNEKNTAFLGYEYLVFKLHLIDRIAFNCVSLKDRNAFMDFLINEILNIFSNNIKDGLKEDFKKDIRDLYNSRQKEYTEWKNINELIMAHSHFIMNGLQIADAVKQDKINAAFFSEIAAFSVKELLTGSK